MPPYVQSRQEGPVLWLSLHNPPVNFLTTDMVLELFEAFKKAEKDESVRVVAVTGGLEDTFIMHFSIPELSRIAGDNKKLGMDRLARRGAGRWVADRVTRLNLRLMDWFPGFEKWSLALAKKGRDKNQTLLLWLAMHRLYQYIERFPKVTVAAVNGPVNGGGVELAACFDFRFMVGDQGFTMGQPEVLVSIVPGGGSTQRLPRIMGRARALEWMLAGNQLTPEKAKDWGLLTDVFPKKDFYARVQAFCGRMAKRPPIAVDAIKKCVDAAFGGGSTTAAGLSAELVQSLRCFAEPSTEKTLNAYARLLEEQVEVPEEERMEPEELFDIMENARFMEK